MLKVCTNNSSACSVIKSLPTPHENIGIFTWEFGILCLQALQKFCPDYWSFCCKSLCLPKMLHGVPILSDLYTYLFDVCFLLEGALYFSVYFIWFTHFFNSWLGFVNFVPLPLLIVATTYGNYEIFKHTFSNNFQEWICVLHATFQVL